MGYLEVIVNKNAIKNNAEYIKSLIPSGTSLFAVIKSNAYGHGLVECAKVLEGKVEGFAVSSIEEAISLRDNGIKKRCILLSGFMPGEAEYVVKYNLEVAVSDMWMLEELSKISQKLNKPINIHIKIDTGMGRLGFMPEDLKNVINYVTSQKSLKLKAMMSHFSSADEEDEESTKYTKLQIERFLNITSTYREFFSEFHIANSAGVLRYPESHMDAVRVGIALYGGIKDERGLLKEAMSAKTKIVTIKTVPAGWYISYGRTYKTRKRKKIGIIPIGYALGFSRNLSSKAKVVVNGKRCNVLGKICMDLTVIDLENVKANPGDDVYILGGESEKISVFELARWMNTITYEVFCLLGNKISRKTIYI